MNRATLSHPWEFTSRFRRHAFGWRSQPAIQRIHQAVSEIKKIARRDPLLGGEGAVLLLERISPALENVDGLIRSNRHRGQQRYVRSDPDHRRSTGRGAHARGSPVIPTNGDCALTKIWADNAVFVP